MSLNALQYKSDGYYLPDQLDFRRVLLLLTFVYLNHSNFILFYLVKITWILIYFVPMSLDVFCIKSIFFFLRFSNPNLRSWVVLVNTFVLFPKMIQIFHTLSQ